MHFRLFDLNSGEARELQSNLVRSHSRRLGALDGRWRPGPPQRRACPTPSTSSGEGAAERSKELFPRLCTYRGRQAGSGWQGEAPEGFISAARRRRRGGGARSGRPQESPAHLGVHCAPARNGEGSFRQLQKTQKPNAKCL